MSFLKLARNKELLSNFPKSFLLRKNPNTLRHRFITSNCLKEKHPELFRHLIGSYRAVQTSIFKHNKTVSSLSVRYLSSKNPDGPDEDRHAATEEENFTPQLPAAVAVPEVWPHVPVIAINKNIVFPRFIKLIELTNPQLIELVRRKVKLNQPYCGIFLKKQEDNEGEVVNSISDVHNVGVFAQIHEMQDLGDRLRLVVMAHRRIKITGQILESVEEQPKGM